MSDFLRTMNRSYLSNSIREQQNREMQQQEQMRGLQMNAYLQQQQQAQRAQQAAAIAARILPGAMTGKLPENVEIPGATRMPGGGMGGYIPQSGGGGFGGPQSPPQMPSMGGGEIYRPAPTPVTPGSAPIRDEGARQPSQSSAAPAVSTMAPTAAKSSPGSKYTPPSRGQNMITLDHLGTYIDSQYPGLDPESKLAVMMKYRDFVSDEHKTEMDDWEGRLKGVNAETSANQAGTAAARERRVADQEASRLGLEERRVKVLEGKAAQPAKVPVALQRYKMATNDATTSANEIKRIVNANPLALGAWGAAYKGIAGLGAQFDQPTPEVAQAASQLDVEFENLFQSLGVAGTYGGMGASTLTKRWEEALGNKSLLTSKDRMLTKMDQLLKGLNKHEPVATEAPAPESEGQWSIAPVEE